MKKGKNILEVEVSAEPGKTNGGESDDNRGIWQDTYLKAYPDVFVENDTWVQTSFENNKIICELPLRNCTGESRKVFIRNFITDQEGNIVKIFDGGWQDLTSGEVKTINISDTWEDPHLWFPHDPYLYNLNTVLYNENENPLDQKSTRFGFREITWDGPHLYINGRELYLRGHGGHYCGDLQGTKEFAKQWFNSLKEKGVNFMRLHVYPKHHSLYEAADEVGFLLEAEAAFHFKVPEDKEFAKKHVTRMIKDERNHPSVVVWSVSNELRWRGGGEKKYLIDHAQSVDDTRPVFASDFSGWSVHGDVLGHHYNGDSVFSEWEEFGPDKPMIWDEVGNVWQPDRPLKNGTAGYEVTAQDYATGLWRDGHDQMLKNLKNIEAGEEINDELHRVNGKIPWDLSYNFFRFQPINNHQTLDLEWNDLNTPGLKQNFIKSCASTLNIWDDNLPIDEPNPGYYFFEKYMRAVRFWDEKDNINFYGGQKIEKKSKLIYEDTRMVDTLNFKVESRENGQVLTSREIPFNLKPGAVKEEVKITWDLPEVKEVTSVKYVREFSYQDKPGYRDEIKGKIFPEFKPEKIEGITNKKIGIYDPAGKTKNAITDYGLEFMSIDKLSQVSYPEVDILIIGEKNEINNLKASFVKKGGRVICLRQTQSPELPVNMPSLLEDKDSARFLLNGAEHFILDQLGQEDFYHWRNGAIDNAYSRPYQGRNFRIILSGDKDGATTPLFEIMEGKGTYVFCQLKIIDSLIQEPVAGHIFKNMLKYTATYQPAADPGKTALIINNS
ncbi:MAG: glycoside hydrolase family 2 TIM barrel-domain containing protein, partial [Bacillota bacterium]